MLLCAHHVQLVTITESVLEEKRGTDASEFTVDNHSDTVAQDVGLLHCMSSQHKHTVALKSLNELPDLPATNWIHAGSRLVEKHNTRVSNASNADRETPLHATREGLDLSVCYVREEHALQNIENGAVNLALWYALDAGEHAHVFGCSQLVP